MKRGILTLGAGLFASAFALAWSGNSVAATSNHEIERMYPDLPLRAIAEFQSLPWTSREKDLAIKHLGQDAILAAVVLGDYSPLLDLPAVELKALVPKATKLLGGLFLGFWEALGWEARERLLAHPSKFRLTLDILRNLAQLPDADLYREFLAKHPDLLVLVHRFPTLLQVNKERLPILCQLLQHIHLGAAGLPQLEGISLALGQSWERAVQFYTLNSHLGRSAALLYLAFPDLFKEQATPVEDTLRWYAVCSQLPFITELREHSADWSRDRVRLAELLSRNTTALPAAQLQQVLQQTPEDRGAVLRAFWNARYVYPETTQESDLEGLVAYFVRKDFPYFWLSEIIGIAQEAEDITLLVKTCTDQGFERSKSEVPLGMLAVLRYGHDDRFLPLLRKYRERFIVYLYDNTGGVADPDLRYRDATQFDLDHYEFDRSWLKKVVKKVPKGTLLIVSYKIIRGYPVSKVEYLDVVMDLAGIVKVPLKMIFGQASGELGKVRGDRAKVLSKPHVRWMLLELEELYLTHASHKRTAEMERQLIEELEREFGTLTGLDSHVLWLMDKGNMPLRRLEQRSCSFEAHGQRVTLRFPDTLRDWTTAVNGNDADRAVLFVTLRDLEKR